LWCLLWAFFDLPDFIVDEEFVLETVVFSVRLFVAEETVEALLVIVKVSANANTIKIVFMCFLFLMLLIYDSNVQREKPNRSYQHVNALLKLYRTSFLLNIFTYPIVKFGERSLSLIL